ncbi:hypothetical protein ACXIVK_27990 [Paraburkholderia caledonica]|jgi:hypothetical protein
MRRIVVLLACLVPLVAMAQAQEKIPGVTAVSPVDRAVPASAVDSDGAYIEFSAVVSNGTSSIELGRYLSASDCTHRIELASTSPEFEKAIHEHPIIYFACVVSRQKA